MKPSRKILIVVMGLFIILLIITMVLLRNGVQSLQLKAESEHKYEAVPAEQFEKLDFSSHWIVKIRQGKECKVELTDEEHSVLKPQIENINGTLYFKVDTTLEKETTGRIHARIIMPSLQEIKAVRGTEIQMDNFQADSVHVVLENGCVFTGNNNTIKYVSFKTSGDNWLHFTKAY
jgi:hypothetical protein